MTATSTAGESEYGFSLGELTGGVFAAVLITAFLAACLWAAHYFGWAKPELEAAQVQVDEARVQLADAQAQAAASKMTPAEIEAAKQAEYIRGVYDLCVWANQDDGAAAQTGCLGFVAHVVEEGWYSQPSPGWSGGE